MPHHASGRAFGYARVSGREQATEGTSLAEQPRTIRARAARDGFASVDVRIEVESASAERTERRVELLGLLQELRDGDTFYITTIDRFSRDLVWGVKTARELVARGVRLIAIQEDIDATTEAGDERLGLLLWVAERERIRIKRRMVGARKALRDQGYYADGLSPFGYQRGPRAERRQLELLPVEEELAIVREAFERCARGASVDEIREWIEIEANRRFDKGATHNLLRNRIYLGEVKSSRGAWIPGKHPAAITWDLYERAQAGLAARRLGGRKPAAESRTAGWLLRGLAVCSACGSRMGAAYSRGGHDYYACAGRLRKDTCDAAYRRVDATDAAVAALAVARLIDLREALARPAAAPRRRGRGRDFAVERQALSARRERAIGLATRGTISEADLARQLAEVDAELGRLALAESAAEREARAASAESRAELLGQVEILRAVWDRMSVAERRPVVSALAARIELGDDGPRMTWRTEAELGAELRGEAAVAAHLSGPTVDEPPKKPGKRGRR